MKRKIVQDEFFDKQPPLTFVEYLKKPVHQKPPSRFARTEAEEGEASVRGIYLIDEFPDPRGLLRTSFTDFDNFVRVTRIGGHRYPVRIVRGETQCFEAYVVDVTKKGCTITAADTEGVRRALIWLEDEMTAAEGPFLPLGKTERHPWLRERITRGFFSPTNRPPKNGDELLDDVDYYPDEYLNRLMHNGTNGLWIYTSFRQLLSSSILKEIGENGERRIAKLNRVIAKCAAYGIKVYVFAIEPMLPADIAGNYPDMIGQQWGGTYTMCPQSEQAKAYCYEAGAKLFTLCPDLAGLISITNGERTTSCASPYICSCPRCRGMERAKILDNAIEMLRAGIRSVKPDAYFVSWTYEHRTWPDDQITEYVKGAPDDIMLMENFDDRGFEKQLGKERQAMDYWLSYVGPSCMFETAARAAKKYKKHLWAKMQICCSHEIATLPYVPSPGNVFGKMKGAHKWGVEGVMECWYFGNYPCFMNKASSDLAFVHDFSDEDAYLYHLAAITYGRGIAGSVVRAWRLFEKGYRLYPLNIMFSYYSPMHDGVVWELSLKPKNFSPSRSWLLLDKPDGDRICDSFLTGHTIDEVLTLLGSMKNYYKRAMAELGIVSAHAGDKLSDLLSVSGAFLTLCRSSYNIVKFYKLRDQLGTGESDPTATLAKMRDLVLKEIENSTKMIILCEGDGRLGYHSEAEGFKFFPEKLRHRIDTLKNLLATEFPEVEARVAAGLPPLEYYLGVEEDCEHSYTIKRGDICDAAWEQLSDTTGFRIAEDEENLTFEFRAPAGQYIVMNPEFRLFTVEPPIMFCIGDATTGSKIELNRNIISCHWPYFKCFDEAFAKWKITKLPAEEDPDIRHCRVSIRKEDTGMRGTAPFKLEVYTWGGACWENEPVPVCTLGKSTLSPGRFGWIFHEDGVAYTPYAKPTAEKE